MISYYKKIKKDEKFQKLSSFEPDSWISVVNPSKNELDQLCKEFELEKRSLISGLDQAEIPRLDIIDEKTYLVTKDLILPREKQTLLIVAGKDFLLTLSKKKPSFINKIFKNQKEFYTTQKLKSLIKILFLINKSLEKATSKIVKNVKIQNFKNKTLSKKELEELLEEESFLNKLLSDHQYILLTYKRAAKKANFSDIDKELLEDLI